MQSTTRQKSSMLKIVSGEMVVILAMCSSLINFAFSYSVQPFINAAEYGWTFTFFGLGVCFDGCGNSNDHVREEMENSLERDNAGPPVRKWKKIW
jgi:hypothetical protein